MTTGDLSVRRAAAIERRRALSTGQRADYDAAIAERVLTGGWFASARRIGLYLAVGGEVDPTDIGRAARDASASTWYPIAAVDESMRFRRWDGIDPTRPGPFGVPEPPLSVHDDCAAAALDVVIVPVVLFGPGGVRVGRGGGHYDRTLAHRLIADGPPATWGVAYDFQEDVELQAQSWDVPLDGVITPTRTLRWT